VKSVIAQGNLMSWRKNLVKDGAILTAELDKASGLPKRGALELSRLSRDFSTRTVVVKEWSFGILCRRQD
jgi:hypothetical protein